MHKIFLHNRKHVHNVQCSTYYGQLSSLFLISSKHKNFLVSKSSQTFSSSSSSTTTTKLWSNSQFTQGLLSLLSNQQRSLLDEQREISKSVIDLAQKVGGVNLQHSSRSMSISPFLQQILETSNARKENDESDNNVLRSTFSVVVAGEFNSGKSTIINALLGQKLLETGNLPTTDTITVLTSKKSSSSSQNQEQIMHNDYKNITTTIHSKNAITLHCIPNVPLLQDLTFIDTPGTNAIITNHTTRTMNLLPSADLILFVTSADRPFPESERQLLHSIQAYRKNIVIVINKMDVLDSSGGDHGDIEKKKITDFVADNAADLLGARAVIISVSAKNALSAKLISSHNGSSGDRGTIESSKLWKRSGFDALESFLRVSLTDEAKIQAKLLNPLGVTDGLLSECLKVLEQKKAELETDILTLNLLNNQMNSWRRDMDSDVDQFQVDVREQIEKEKNRCKAFVDSMGFFEMYTLFIMNNHAMLETKWEITKSLTVSDDIENEILEKVRESTDSIATSARAQGQAIIEYLGKRPSVVGHNLIGNVTAASRFEDTRKDLCDKMTKAVKATFASYDSEKEKESVFGAMRTTILLSTAFSTLSITSVAMTVMEIIDLLTGGCTIATFVVLGIGVVPHRSSGIIKDYELQWETRNDKLSAALDTLCKKEITRIHKRILDGVAPYSRYVTTEQDNVNIFTEECNKLSASSQSLRNRIIKLR